MRTAVGDSETREIREVVAQGSMEGSLNLSQGVTDFFATSESEISYASLTIPSCEFQDDIFRACKDPASAQAGNDRLEALAETKLLDFHTSKSKIIVVGKTKAREKLKEEFEENPPYLYGVKVEIADQETYLGDEFGKSVSDSISLTIRKREGLVRKSIIDIKRIVEDHRSKVMGSIKTGLLLWEMCVIPYLLNNASTWLEIKQSDMDVLN